MLLFIYRYDFSLAGFRIQSCCIGELRLKRGQRGDQTLDICVINTTL